MSTFTLHTIESSTEESKPLLEKSKREFGMVPNLMAVLANAPAALEGYQKLHESFLNSSFDAKEITVVWQCINVEHNCTYCVPAHTGGAHSMNVYPALTEALRERQPMPTTKLQALYDFTLAMVRERGEVSEQQLSDFYDAGYGERQVLEIILGLSQKVISNYTNHIAKTPLDKPFQQFSWTKS